MAQIYRGGKRPGFLGGDVIGCSGAWKLGKVPRRETRLHIVVGLPRHSVNWPAVAHDSPAPAGVDASTCLQPCDTTLSVPCATRRLGNEALKREDKTPM